MHFFASLSWAHNLTYAPVSSGINELTKAFWSRELRLFLYNLLYRNCIKVTTKSVLNPPSFQTQFFRLQIPTFQKLQAWIIFLSFSRDCVHCVGFLVFWGTFFPPPYLENSCLSWMRCWTVRNSSESCCSNGQIYSLICIPSTLYISI